MIASHTFNPSSTKCLYETGSSQCWKTTWEVNSQY